MKDRLDLLEDRVDELLASVKGIEARLRRLEASRDSSAPAALRDPEVGGAPTGDLAADGMAVHAAAVAGVLPTLGRAFLVLCGAFFLRSLTEAGILPQAVGVALGYVYAVLWVVLADRAAAAGRRLAATLSGCVASIIAYPLLWEATGRFALLSASAAVAGLVLFTALTLAVAWRRDLNNLATIVTIAALATDLVLLLGFRCWGPASLAAFALAAYSIWCGYLRGWLVLRWPVALTVDLVPTMMISDAIRGLEPGIPAGPPTSTVLLAAAGLIAVYLGSFAVAMLGMKRRVGVFEVVQGVAVVAAGFGSAHHLLNALHLDDRIFGAITLLVGLACYGAAFVFVDRRFARGGNFFYFSSLALVLSIGGAATATDGSVRVAVLSLFGVAAAVLGVRFSRMTLRWHAALDILAATVVGGTAGRVVAAYTFPPDGVSRPPSAADLIAISAAVVCAVVFSSAGGRPSGSWSLEIPDLVVEAIGLVGVGALGLTVFVQMLGQRGPVDPSLLAAARTVVLAVLAVASAALGSFRGYRALHWLVYPLLVVGGLKLIVEDLRYGRPAMLFVAFAVFGIALIMAPRLRRSAAPPEDGSADA